MSKLNEILKLLLDLNVEELRTVQLEAKDRRTKINRSGLKLGDKVFIPKDNSNEVYTIEKINKVNFVIKSTTTRKQYNCPPSMMQIKREL